MRFDWSGLALLSIILIASAHSNASGGETDALGKRILDEAPRRWQDLREMSLQIQGELNISHTRFDGAIDIPGDKWRYQIAQNGQWKNSIIRGTLTNSARKKVTRVMAVNSKYAFTLAEGKTHDGWILGDLEVLLPNKKLSIELELVDKVIYETTCANLIVNDMPLPQMIASKDFRMKKIEKYVDGAIEYVSISFEFNKGKKAYGPFTGPFSGTIVLDPGNYWVMKRADLHCDIGTRNDRTEHIENTYTKSPRGFPIPQLTTVQTKIKNFIDLTKREYSLREQADVPEHEFSLSAFGLPEPLGFEIPRPSKTRYYLWFCLGGIALIAFGVVVVRLAKRWRATPAPDANKP